ncbi:MAG: hypothetical protein HYU67_09690 [Flavobacteriia bacterium]|nr:hypothetical protein [Flavobacteriia bacterium]
MYSYLNFIHSKWNKLLIYNNIFININLIIVVFFIFYCPFFFSQEKTIKNNVTLFFDYNTNAPNSINNTHYEDYYVDLKSYKNYRAAYGAGIGWGLSFKRIIHPNILLYLSPSYHKGFNSHVVYHKTDSTEKNGYIQSKQILLNPGIQLQVPIQRFYVIMQCGVIIPIKVNSTYKEEDSFMETKLEWNYSYNFNAGFQGGIGINVPIIRNLYLGILLHGKLCSFTLKDAHLERFDQNGVSLINDLDEYDKHYIYHEDLNNFSNNNLMNSKYDVKLAKDELTKSHSFSSLGIQFSISYEF